MTPIPNIDQQLAELNQLNYLYNIQNLLNAYVIKNILLTGVGANTKTIGVINPNLYQIASEQYSDATLWTAIASANGLVGMSADPFPAGVFSLIIPPKPTISTGGIAGI